MRREPSARGARRCRAEWTPRRRPAGPPCSSYRRGSRRGSSCGGVLAQEQEALAQELQQELGREIERSRGLQDQVEALRESEAQLEQRCAEGEASLLLATDYF